MHERRTLIVIAVAMFAALALFLIGRSRPAPPSAADGKAIAAVIEQSLDSPNPKRFELWHAAHEQLMRLEPHRPASAIPFIRTGFFHWYELSEADRHSVIEAVEPVLRDESQFGVMAKPLFQLTGDFTILRRANPGTESALRELAGMAVINGRFADYRSFRDQLRKRLLDRFESLRKTATPVELVAFVPQHPTTADLPLINGILNALHVRPIDTNKGDANRVDVLIDFAIEHGLEPLDGLDAVVHIADAASDPQRARLAVRLGQFDRASEIESATKVSDRTQWRTYHLERAMAELQRQNTPMAVTQLLLAAEAGQTPAVLALAEEVQRAAGNYAEADSARAALRRIANRVQRWEGLCDADVCNEAHGELWSDGGPFAMKLATVQTDDVAPYAEVYADDAPASEGAVSPAFEVRADLLRGVRRIEIHLANPMTRNAVRRRIRIE